MEDHEGTVTVELEVSYKAIFSPEEKATRDHPGCPAEVEIEIIGCETVDKENEYLIKQREADAWEWAKDEDERRESARDDAADWKRDSLALADIALPFNWRK